MSIVRANKIQTINGQTFQGVLQVQSAIVTASSTYSQGGATNQWTDLIGLSVNITPYFSTSKILILCQLSITGSSNNYNAYVRINRNGTIVGQGNNEYANSGGLGASVGIRSFNDYAQHALPIIFYDSPATNSSLTYKLQHNNGNTTYINRAPIGTDGWQSVCSSTITVMEIAQ